MDTLETDCPPSDLLNQRLQGMHIDGYPSTNDYTVVTNKSGHYQIPMNYQQNILVSGRAYHGTNGSGRSSRLNQQNSRNDSISTSNMELGSLPSVFSSRSRNLNQADCVGHFFSHSPNANDTISSEVTSNVGSNVFLQQNIPISSDLPSIDRHTLNNTEVPQQTIYFNRPKVDIIKPSNKFNFPVELKNSKYPDYKDKVRRIQSFAYSTSEIRNPQQMSDAGFFAISNQDFVRCFHCGIGLRNWEDDDDPYVEHVRWSPSCQYMLNKKGKAFVDAVQEAVKKVQLEEALEQSETREGGDLDGAIGYSDLTENGEAYPRHVLEKNPLLCNAAQKVVEMGYLPRVVKKAIDILMLDGGLPGLTAERIANLVMDMESKGEKVMIPVLQATESHTSRAQVSNDSKQTLEEQNREFKEKISCVICCENQRCITFLPCGHLVCCAQCAPACNNCPVCRKEIKGTVKVNFH